MRTGQDQITGCLQESSVPTDVVMRLFDGLPRHKRDMVNNSPYKLCTACVVMGLDPRMMEQKIAERLKCVKLP